MDEKSCCFTGYRPSKFPFELAENDKKYNEFQNSLICTLKDLIDDGYRTFYTGMAMGFDIIAAENVVLLKERYPQYEIKLVCVIPFSKQCQTFEDDWKQRYDGILENADEKIVLSDNYFRGCYSKRNRFMVDRSDTVVTWYDGKSGGTQNTLGYASKTGRYIINLDSENEYDYTNFEVYALSEE